MKLCISFLHGMRMCMWFGCNCSIIFFYFFPHCELNHFSPSIYRQWLPREHNSSYNFILIFLQLCTCFLLSLKMCMCFSYNPCRSFLLFCTFWTLSFSDLKCTDSGYLVIADLRCTDSGYLVIATFHTILNRSFLNFAHVFSCVCRSAHGLDMIFNLFLSLFPL